MTKSFVYFLFILIAAFLTTGCSKDTDNDGEEVVPFFEVTCPQLDNIAWEGTVFTLSVESNAEWSVVSNAGWCKVADNVSGNANAEVTIEISDNLTGESREATIQFTWGVEGEKNEIKVVQEPQPFVEGGLYKIPVVFQMLYGNRNIETQYVKEGHLQTVLDGVNELYRQSGQNLNIEFVMATETPTGEPMEEPGVNRVEWTTSTIDCIEFMESDEQRYLDIIWDPSKYINVVLYNFSNPQILGISQFPFLMAPDALPGVESLYNSAFPTQENLDRPQCVSINNRYIYDTAPLAVPGNPEGSLTNVVSTLAHELGHFLGLRHAFSESYSGACIDSDFCDDTPTYNRQNYERLVQAYGMSYKEHIDELITREPCNSGESFISTNIMDYSITYSNEFTPQQAERIRYILEHGVFIPGPKNYPEISASRVSGKMKLPFEIME